MILIFSYHNDTSTTDVMRWLHRLDYHDIIRVNEDDLDGHPTVVEMSNDSFVVSTRGRTFALSEVEAVWFRKGQLWFDSLFPSPSVQGHPALQAKLGERLLVEARKAKEYFHFLIQKHCRVLGNPTIANPNKLIVLNMAAEAGLCVPDLLVANDPRQLQRWASSSSGPAVAKPMSDGMYLWDFEHCGNGYFSYTERVSNSMYSEAVRIPLSLLQREIKKRFEVRSFYLDGTFYSMAIFSQRDASTSIDYRKYNHEKPNRTIPFKLPEDVEARLDTLFRKMGLNTGSADLIVDEEGRYVFLEINPSGQYAGLSIDCNYCLDMKIANWLMGKNGYDADLVAA